MGQRCFLWNNSCWLTWFKPAYVRLNVGLMVRFGTFFFTCFHIINHRHKGSLPTTATNLLRGLSNGRVPGQYLVWACLPDTDAVHTCPACWTAWRGDRQSPPFMAPPRHRLWRPESDTQSRGGRVRPAQPSPTYAPRNLKNDNAIEQLQLSNLAYLMNIIFSPPRYHLWMMFWGNKMCCGCPTGDKRRRYHAIHRLSSFQGGTTVFFGFSKGILSFLRIQQSDLSIFLPNNLFTCLCGSREFDLFTCECNSTLYLLFVVLSGSKSENGTHFYERTSLLPY